MDLLEKIRSAKRVWICGNGGSYSNAQHFANDLEMRGIRAYVINPATMTATANDHGYEYIYSKWIMLHGEPGDLLIALSGSGKSKNILNALEAARLIGMTVHTIFGAELGQDMQRAEEHQVVVGHEIYKALK